MTRTRLMMEIDKAFENFADGKLSLVRLQSEVRMLVATFCDEVAEEAEQLHDTLADYVSGKVEMP